MAQQTPDDNLIEADCGHRVPKSKTVSVPEVLLCEECYTPCPVTEWPRVPESYKSYAGQNYHGSAEYHTTETVLLGLDRRGRAVYWDQSDVKIRYVVPMNDRAYKQDRDDAEEGRRYDLRPMRSRHVGPEPDPGHPGRFLTLPNGDHITAVELEEGFQPYETGELREWLVEETADWQAVHPKMIERFDLDGWGSESGKPLTTKRCTECGYTEVVDPVGVVDCPECGHYKFREVHDDPEVEG